MRDPSTPRVFVSYSRKDGLEFARRLQALLEAEGLSLYRDLTDLEGGEDWWRQVEAAIRSVEQSCWCCRRPRCARPTWRGNGSSRARRAGRSRPSRPGELDFSHLPRWMERAHRHDIDIPESRARLVQVLKGPAGEKRVPFMADALPEASSRAPRSSTRSSAAPRRAWRAGGDHRGTTRCRRLREDLPRQCALPR